MFETQENDTEKLDFAGVDWNWGDDEKPAATDEGEDSDATAEMTEESDNEITGNNDGDDDEKPFDFDAEDAKQASPAKERASDDDAASDANEDEEEANEEEANAKSDEEELEIEAPITNDDDLEEEDIAAFPRLAERIAELIHDRLHVVKLLSISNSIYQQHTNLVFGILTHMRKTQEEFDAAIRRAAAALAAAEVSRSAQEESVRV